MTTRPEEIKLHLVHLHSFLVLYIWRSQLCISHDHLLHKIIITTRVAELLSQRQSEPSNIAVQYRFFGTVTWYKWTNQIAQLLQVYNIGLYYDYGQLL